MNNTNARTLLVLGALAIGIAIAVNLASAGMWGHGSYGRYGHGSYGPMMGGGMWGDMGLFWMFPVIGLICMVAFVAIVGRMFFWNTHPVAGGPTLQCSHCAQGVRPDWVACPYCGTAIAPSQTMAPRPPLEK